MPRLTISKLAKAAGVTVETIRFYQRRGLLAEPDRPLGGIRHYGTPDLARVMFIKAAQRIGFTLDEIVQLLRLDDGMHCAEARAIAVHKLEMVRARQADLSRIADALEHLVGQCDARRGKVNCPLIDALQPGLATDD